MLFNLRPAQSDFCSSAEQKSLPHTYLIKGEEYYRNGDYDSAIQAYGQAIYFAPESLEACRLRGQAYYVRMKSWEHEHTEESRQSNVIRNAP